MIGGNNVAGQDIVVTLTAFNDSAHRRHIVTGLDRRRTSSAPLDPAGFRRVVTAVDGTSATRDDHRRHRRQLLRADARFGAGAIGFASPVTSAAVRRCRSISPAAAFPGPRRTLNGTGAGFTNSSGTARRRHANRDLTINDGRGADAVITSSVVITPVNDSPDLSAAAPVTSIEQAPTAVLAGVTVSDVDLDARNGGLGDYAGATFSVDRASSPNAEDLFSLVAGAGFTIDGNRLEAGGLAFATFSVDPTGYILIELHQQRDAGDVGSGRRGDPVDPLRQRQRHAAAVGRHRLRHSTTDGRAAARAAAATGQVFEMVTVNLTAVNDAPVNGLTPTQAGTEDTNVVFSVAGGNAITVSDAEATTLEVTIVVAHGVLTLADTTDLVFTAGDGTGDATMTFSGTAAAINHALDGLVYRGNLNHHGLDSLTVTTRDLGVAGTGGTLTDQDVITISLAANGIFDGDSGDNDMTGTDGADLFLFQHGGADHGHGLGSNDRFYFGETFGAGDRVDGGSGDDALLLQGKYDLTFGSDQLSGIERLRLLNGGGSEVDYVLRTSDGNVGAGQQLRVDAQDLRAGESLEFIGMAETDGTFWVLGGASPDLLVGGARNDRLSGGGGNPLASPPFSTSMTGGSETHRWSAGRLRVISRICSDRRSGGTRDALSSGGEPERSGAATAISSCATSA